MILRAFDIRLLILLYRKERHTNTKTRRWGFESPYRHQPIFKKKMEQKVKKAIVPTLRAMEVGEKEIFPLEQFGSVRNTIYGVNLCVERAAGSRWSLKSDLANSRVVVTRVS